MNVRKLAIVVAVVAGGACAPAAPTHDAAADKAAIDKVRADYAAAFKAGDAAKVASLFTADAIVMENAQPTGSGAAAAEAAIKGMVDMMSSQEITITPERTEVSGDLAYDVGKFSLALTPKVGAPMTDGGRYVVVLKRQADGSWKIAADIGNTPTPAVAMPAPPAAKK